VTEIPLTEIPFILPHATGNEVRYIQEAIEAHYLGGDGQFTDRCSRLLAERTGSARAFLTTSCTAALELAVALAGIRPGDEVIMPSFTFPTTAGAVARAGGTPVFVDIREDTLNLDEHLVREALTPQTKALLPVHYAGVGCEMDELMTIASARDLFVIEDAAQGLMAAYRDRHLGSIGQLGCLSFH
jgi:dTDP-4-amino-4,6-dideoxygalactose transaminase